MVPGQSNGVRKHVVGHNRDAEDHGCRPHHATYEAFPRFVGTDLCRELVASIAPKVVSAEKRASIVCPDCQYKKHRPPEPTCRVADGVAAQREHKG